jgi:HK97 gp10 family phage protein
MAKLNFDLVQISKEAEAEFYKALESGATKLVSDAKANAPISTGKLRTSINTKNITTKKGERMMAVGPDKIDYAFYVEVGANSKAPNPFMRKSFMTNRDKIARAMETAANNIVKKHNSKTS